MSEYNIDSNLGVSSDTCSTNSTTKLLNSKHPTYEDFLAYNNENVRNAMCVDADSTETLESFEQRFETESVRYGSARFSRESVLEILTQQYTDIYYNDTFYLLNVMCGNSDADYYPNQMDKFDKFYSEILQKCENFQEFFETISAVFGRYFVWLKFNAFDNTETLSEDDESFGKPLLADLMARLAPLFFNTRSISSMFHHIEENINTYESIFVKPFFLTTTNSDNRSIQAAFRAAILLDSSGIDSKQKDSENVETGGMCDSRLTSFLLIFSVIHELFRGDIDFYRKFVSRSNSTSVKCCLTTHAMSPTTTIVDRMHFSNLCEMFLIFRNTFGLAFEISNDFTESILDISKSSMKNTDQQVTYLDISDRTYCEKDANGFSYPSLNDIVRIQYEHDEMNAVDFFLKYENIIYERYGLKQESYRSEDEFDFLDHDDFSDEDELYFRRN